MIACMERTEWTATVEFDDIEETEELDEMAPVAGWMRMLLGITPMHEWTRQAPAATYFTIPEDAGPEYWTWTGEATDGAAEPELVFYFTMPEESESAFAVIA